MRPLLPLNEGPLADRRGGAWIDRLIALAILASAIWWTVSLTQIQPSAKGHGTHVQLGLEPCGWATQLQIPCPGCGMTTAATHLVHGSVLSAISTQPMGVALALAGWCAALMAAWCLVRGKSFLGWTAYLPWGTLFLAGLVLLLGSWLYVYLTFQP